MMDVFRQDKVPGIANALSYSGASQFRGVRLAPRSSLLCVVGGDEDEPKLTDHSLFSIHLRTFQFFVFIKTKYGH